MAINFPSNPALNDEFTSGTSTWIWNGVAWNIKPPGSSLNDLSDVSTSSATSGQLLGYNGTTWVPTSLSGSFNGGIISGSLKINNNTVSSSATTGALQVTGGVGIGGDVHITGHADFGGNISTIGRVDAVGINTTSDVAIKNRHSLKLYDTDNSNFISLISPNALSSDFIFVLPSSYGTSGQFLQSNGSGGLSWATPPSGGGGGGVTNPPGGNTGDIQYNSGAGTFAGSATLSYDINNDIVNVTNLTASSTVAATDVEVTNSVTTVDLTASGTILGNITSSAVQISGGTISGTTQASLTTLSASDSVSFTKTTNSTSYSTGAMVISGGVGIGQDVYVNGKISVNTTVSATGNISTNNNVSASGNVVSGGNIISGGNITAGQNVIINTLPSSAVHATNKQYVDTRSLAMSIAMS